MKPTEAALRAAQRLDVDAWLANPSKPYAPLSDKDTAKVAAVIDRETGLPDLLEALKEYHKANRLKHDEDARLYGISEAAIAKAEGK